MRKGKLKDAQPDVKEVEVQDEQIVGGPEKPDEILYFLTQEDVNDLNDFIISSANAERVGVFSYQAGYKGLVDLLNKKIKKK